MFRAPSVRLAIWLSAMTAGCAAPQAPRCDFPLTRPMLVAELYFGRADVSDAAWASFAADTLTNKFPDGFTVLDAAGQWRAAPDQPISREASKLVVIAAQDTAASMAGLEAVMAEYRKAFRQQSVGIVLDHRCAAF